MLEQVQTSLKEKISINSGEGTGMLIKCLKNLKRKREFSESPHHLSPVIVKTQVESETTNVNGDSENANIQTASALSQSEVGKFVLPG